MHDIGPPQAGDFPDLYRIVERRIGEEDVDEARLTLEGPLADPESWLVGRIDGRVAACLQMLAVEVRVGTVELAGGTIEFVATDPEHEGKGLVRALMDEFHRRERERHSLIQVIEGIPYFYRRFGYEYVWPTPDDVWWEQPPHRDGQWAVRTGSPADVDLVRSIQGETQRSFDVVVGHSDTTWRWILESPVYRTFVAEHQKRSAMLRVCTIDDTNYVFDTAGDPAGVGAILAHIHPERAHRVLSRRPVTDAFEEEATIDPRHYARYGRVADPIALLGALRPELERRIADLGIEDRTTAISLYGSSIQLDIRDGQVLRVGPGRRMQAVLGAEALGVPPDLIASLLLGPLGAEGLRIRHPDVVFDPSDPLWPAMFPAQTVDVQTWVYP